MPARVAVEAAEAAGKAVSNDIAVFRTRFDVETGKGRKKRLVPVEAELHLNPVSILFAAAAGLAGALAATVAWQGISVPSPIPGVPPIQLLKGLKETTLGRDLNEAYQLRRQLRRARASGGVVVTADPGADPSVVVEDPECTLLNREWARALRRGDSFNADRFLAQAKARSCLWAEQVSP